MSITTPAVQGPTQSADPVTPFRIAGDEYLVINGSDLLGESETVAATMRIDLTVDGEQVEGPRLAVVGAGTTPTPTAGESTPAPTDQPPAGSDDSAGVPGWPLAVGALALLAVVVALIAVASRRRERGR